MKHLILAATALGLLTSSALAASSTWTSTTGNPLWGFSANWNNGVPNTTTPAVLENDLTTVFSIDIQGANTPGLGITFNAGTGTSGFTFRSSAVSPTGFSVGPSGIINNDSHVQLFTVPITLITANGSGGSLASQTWTAGSGGLLFSNYFGNASSLNNNGGTLTFSGSGNTTFSGASRSDIVGVGGLVKSGGGTLFLGGTVANTFSGGVTLNAGVIQAGKVSALGAVGNKLTLNGGALQANFNNLNTGVLSLQGNATIDFTDGLHGGSGTNVLSFADSHSQSWLAGTTLTIADWTPGDRLRFGTSATGLTSGQLSDIVFAGYPGYSPTIDSSGYVIAVPEPSTVALSLVGGFTLALGFVIRRRKE